MSDESIVGVGDIIIGAEAIALFLFGTPSERRRVYKLADRGELPIFTLGGRLTARKSRLALAIEERERSACRCTEAG